MSSTSSSASSNNKNGDGEEENKPNEMLSSLSFEELMKLKDELGSKAYKEAVLGVESARKNRADANASGDKKRLNKNRPREISSKRQVPFLSNEEPSTSKSRRAQELRDPRFDEKSGVYNVKQFKDNYKFVANIRSKEVKRLSQQLQLTTDQEERKQLKKSMQKLSNQNVEDERWHAKQAVLRQEQAEIQKAHDEGKKPHYTTKKERRAKELVAKFEELKKTGKLNKHLEKRRKKNAAKDRKKIHLD